MLDKIEIESKHGDALRALYNRLLTPIKYDGKPPHYEISLELARELREALFDIVK